MTRMPQGPLTIKVGEVSTAMVDAFDTEGKRFTGTLPTPSWTIDKPAVTSIATDAVDPNAEYLTSLAPGVSNLTLTVAGPDGPLTDKGSITNVGTTTATAPVLASVKINFGVPEVPKTPPVPAATAGVGGTWGAAPAPVASKKTATAWENSPAAPAVKK
jgi:hypothetical protein